MTNIRYVVEQWPDLSKLWLVAFETSYRKIIYFGVEIMKTVCWTWLNFECNHALPLPEPTRFYLGEILPPLSPWDKPAVSHNLWHKQSHIAKLQVQVKSIHWYKYVWKESGWTRTQNNEIIVLVTTTFFSE